MSTPDSCVLAHSSFTFTLSTVHGTVNLDHVPLQPFLSAWRVPAVYSFLSRQLSQSLDCFSCPSLISLISVSQEVCCEVRCACSGQGLDTLVFHTVQNDAVCLFSIPFMRVPSTLVASSALEPVFHRRLLVRDGGLIPAWVSWLSSPFFLTFIFTHHKFLIPFQFMTIQNAISPWGSSVFNYTYKSSLSGWIPLQAVSSFYLAVGFGMAGMQNGGSAPQGLCSWIQLRSSALAGSGADVQFQSSDVIDWNKRCSCSFWTSYEEFLGLGGADGYFCFSNLA